MNLDEIRKRKKSSKTKEEDNTFNCEIKRTDETEVKPLEINSLVYNPNLQILELEEKKKKIKRAKRRIIRNLEYLEDDIDQLILNIIRKGRNEMEDEVYGVCRQMDSIVDNMKFLQNPIEIIPDLNAAFNRLYKYTLKRILENIQLEIQRCLVSNIRSFFIDIEDIFISHFDNFRNKNYNKSFEKNFVLNIANKNSFSLRAEKSGESDEINFFGNKDNLMLLPNSVYFGIPNIFLNNKISKNKLYEWIKEIRNSFNLNDYFDAMIVKKNEVMRDFKTHITDTLIIPLQKEQDEILNNLSEIEKNY